MEKIMKKKIRSIVVIVTLMLTMAAIGCAEISGRIKADVPFAFNVVGKQFQAGKYVVDRLNINGTLIIRSLDNSAVANFNVNNVTDKGEGKARLVFRRYGDQYFLAQVYDGSSKEGQELPKSKTEREVMKKKDIITNNFVQPVLETVMAKIEQ